jgi:hypothetical protein
LELAIFNLRTVQEGIIQLILNKFVNILKNSPPLLVQIGYGQKEKKKKTINDQQVTPDKGSGRQKHKRRAPFSTISGAAMRQAKKKKAKEERKRNAEVTLAAGEKHKRRPPSSDSSRKAMNKTKKKKATQERKIVGDTEATLSGSEKYNRTAAPSSDSSREALKQDKKKKAKEEKKRHTEAEGLKMNKAEGIVAAKSAKAEEEEKNVKQGGGDEPGSPHMILVNSSPRKKREVWGKDLEQVFLQACRAGYMGEWEKMRKNYPELQRKTGEQLKVS